MPLSDFIPQDQIDDFLENAPEMVAGKLALAQEVVEYAKAKNIRATTNTSVRGAEQLPMEFAARLHKLKDGEIVAVPGPGDRDN